MASLFRGLEVEERYRPVARAYDFDLETRLSSVVALEARMPDDAFTAQTLGTERLGNAMVIGATGLVLTIGYLVTEAEEVVLTTNDGAARRRPMCWASIRPPASACSMRWSRWTCPPLPIGNSAQARPDDAVISAGGGGRGACARRPDLLARAPFAGYWEYYLDEALFVEPGPPALERRGAVRPVGRTGRRRLAAHGAALRGGEVTPAQHVRAGRAAAADPRRSRARPPGAAAAALARACSPRRSSATSWSLDVSPRRPGRPRRAAPRRHHPRGRRRARHRPGDFYTALWALGPAGVTVPLSLQREGDVFDVEIRSADRASRLKKRRFN